MKKTATLRTQLIKKLSRVNVDSLNPTHCFIVAKISFEAIFNFSRLKKFTKTKQSSQKRPQST